VAALIAVGVTLCLGSLVALVRRARHMWGALRASGVVVRSETTYEVRLVGVYDRVLVPRDVPIIWFKTADAVEVFVRLRPTRAGRYYRGVRVSCLYDPRDPQYIVRSPMEQWGDLILFLVLGTFCLLSVLWVR
jgi:hypothetical protein